MSILMKNMKPKRLSRNLTAKERARLQRHREQIAKELPDLIASDQMRKEARDESTLSGELRRAIHASPLSLATIATQAGIPLVSLDEFLTGARTLRSDVLDRLTTCLGLGLMPRA